MDFLEELEDMKTIPHHLAITFKFFSLFKVSLNKNEDADAAGVLTWAQTAEETHLSRDVLVAMREFLKAQRQAVKNMTNPPKKGDCSRAMWFWFQKLLEHGAFDTDTRTLILRWMEICELIIS